MAMLCLVHEEMLLAFKSCAKRHGIPQRTCRTLTTFRSLRARGSDTVETIQHSSKARSSLGGKSTTDIAKSSSLQSTQPASSKSNTTLTRIPKPGTLQHAQRPNVPARLLPKARVSPELTLSPKERLQIEYETRRPPKAKEKPVFKERLLIYHGGLGYTNYIALLRVTTMFAAAFGLVIMAPAYCIYESAPWWTVPLIIVATTGPFFLVKFLARPFVAWIYLVLPQHARQSPRAALEYSRNLPQNALLQICFMRATALIGQVEANIADLVPRKGRWPPTTFEWVGRKVEKGTWYHSNPTRFFVNQRSGTGKASRDTVPGIWQNIYERIMGGERSNETKRWKQRHGHGHDVQQ